jgi:hypothetical protein
MADRFELDAIDADDALLDLLAAGGESARTAGEHDPAVKLLADLRLAVEVEDELPVETIDDPESFLARCAALNPVTDPFARKVAARGLALGVAAVAALSVSGVAAAVTGDPLSPYEKVIEKMVDAVRPQTSFPKEQLDGMPVVDKTKIVKVAKDYQKKQEEAKAAEEHKAQNDPLAVGEPPAVRQGVMPPLVLPPQTEQPTAIEQPATTEPTQAPQKPADDEPTTRPSDTTDPTTQPTQPPATTDPTTQPTQPTTDPTPDPTTAPTEQPSSSETGTGETSSDSGSTGDPAAAPSSDTGSADSGSTDTGSTGTGSNTGDQTTGTGQAGDPGSTTGGTETGTNTGQTGTDQPADKTPPADNKPADPVDPVVDLVGKVLDPTASPADVPSAAEVFGSAAKHSSGRVVTGSVRETYTPGTHSSGLYPEGKHAAIERTHGSLESPAVLQILDVVNKATI